MPFFLSVLLGHPQSAAAHKDLECPADGTLFKKAAQGGRDIGAMGGRNGGETFCKAAKLAAKGRKRRKKGVTQIFPGFEGRGDCRCIAGLRGGAGWHCPHHQRGRQVSDLSLEQVAKSFTGEIADWCEVGGSASRIACIGRLHKTPVGSGRSLSPLI